MFTEHPTTTAESIYSPVYQAPSFQEQNLSFVIPSVDFPFNLTMKALDQRLKCPSARSSYMLKPAVKGPQLFLCPLSW